LRKIKEIVASVLLALVLLTLTASVNAQTSPVRLEEYFTFTSTTFNNGISCPSLSYSDECNGGTMGYITSKGSATGSGVLIGFTSAAKEVSFYWTYSSGKYVNPCPDTLTVTGTIKTVTGPAPVTVGSAITVTLTGGNWPSGGVSITAGTYTATLAGQALVYCAV